MDENEIKQRKEFILFKGLFCGIFMLVGTIFVLIAYFTQKSYTYKKERCTKYVTGYVSDIVRETHRDDDGNDHTSLYPEFTYTIDGLTYIKQSNFGSNKSQYHIGKHVNILVDPNNYDTYIVEGDNTQTIFCIVFGGIGGILLLVGIIALFGMKYRTLDEINGETDGFVAEHTISRDDLERELRNDNDSPFVK